nr:hypothetical protein [uncultured Marinifilum sp.]
MKNIETITFASSFIVAFAGMANILPNAVTIILILFALFYLSVGWILISKNKGWLTFFITYLIAQSLVAVMLGINNYSIKNTFAFYTIGLLLILTAYLLFNKKSLTSSDHPVDKYLIRLLVSLSLAMSPIWLHV